MKNITYPFLYVLFALFAFSCSKGEEDFAPAVDTDQWREVGFSVRNGVTGETISGIRVQGWDLHAMFYDEGSSGMLSYEWDWFFGLGEMTVMEGVANTIGTFIFQGQPPKVSNIN